MTTNEWLKIYFARDGTFDKDEFIHKRIVKIMNDWGLNQYIPFHTEIAMLADYLLANGVIVPPCKVGDNIYFNKAETDETCLAKVIKICNNFYTPSIPLWITIEYESKLIGRQEVEMGSDVFELLCFPTKEEAEKALEGTKQ